MEGIGITVHSINAQLVGLSELPNGKNATVLVVPGGRVLLAGSETIALVTELVGQSAKATNPYEQRRRKEFLRRASRSITAYKDSMLAAA